MPSKNLSSYPVEIANSLYKRWCEKGVPRDNLPDCSILESIVDCAYQSSLLREEGEETRCRLLVARRVELDEQRERFPNCIDYLGFDHPIELSPQNIRKLAHAAGFYRSMLLVDPSLPVEQSLWGIAVTGTDWSIHSGTKYTGRRPLPPNVVIQVRGAGNLVLASGNDRLLECVGGIIMEDVFDPFQSSWLPSKFAAVRVGLLDDVRRGLDPAISTELCDTFVKRSAASFKSSATNRTAGC
jgi:hypothetical protein